MFSHSATDCALLIFLQSWVEKLLAWPGIEPTVLDFETQPAAYDLSVVMGPGQ